MIIFSGISAGQTQESLDPALNFPHRIMIIFLHFLAQALDGSISFKTTFFAIWYPADIHFLIREVILFVDFVL